MSNITETICKLYGFSLSKSKRLVREVLKDDPTLRGRNLLNKVYEKFMEL